ncbi:uncharacterized protein LOC135369854 isoform X2 [Ornithodoros turicata]|uniref:uncharacterized protein LOC135369854 isoform X2 n=1 Tax=Ornithodoros turicata TaxID=34597 RepID=UPI003139F318
MIALAIIVVVLTHPQLWDPVECGCSYPACGAGVTNNLKEKITHGHRVLSCKYQPEPDQSCPCYNTETDGTSCMAMGYSEKGACFRGECLDSTNYHSRKRGQQMNYNQPCPVPSDYMYGTVVIPWKAPAGYCKQGYCEKINYDW